MKIFGKDFLHTHPESERVRKVGPHHVIVDKDEYDKLVSGINNILDICQDHITLMSAAADTSSDRVRSKANTLITPYQQILGKLNEILE